MRSVAWGDNVSLKKFIGRRLLIREKNEQATLYFFTGRRARVLVGYFGFFVCLFAAQKLYSLLVQREAGDGGFVTQVEKGQDLAGVRYCLLLWQYW